MHGNWLTSPAWQVPKSPAQASPAGSHRRCRSAQHAAAADLPRRHLRRRQGGTPATLASDLVRPILALTSADAAQWGP
jgi:hypothetical protein